MSTAAPAVAADAPRLTTAQRAIYGVGGIAIGLKSNSLGAFVIPYYADLMGLNPALAGVAIMVSRVWDAVSDPLIGHWSDRTRHPAGRRRVFMRWSIVPWALTMWAFFAAPTGLSQAMLALYLGAMYIAVYTGSTCYGVPYYALGAEISPHYDERTSITGWRTLFWQVGTLVGSLLPAFFAFGDKHPFGLTAHQTWLWIGGVFFVVMSVSGLVSYVGTDESRTHHDAAELPVLQAVKQTLANRAFLNLIVAYSLTAFAWAVVQSLVVLIAKYWLQQQDELGWLILTQLVVGMASVPVWLRASARSSKKAAYRVCLCMLALLFMAAYWLSPARPWMTYILQAIGGAGVAGNTVLSTAILADVCDLDELRTGQRREGSFFSIMWFLTKFPGALGAAVGGFVLVIVKFAPGAEQSADTIQGFRLFFGPFVAIFFAVSAIVIAYFPITRDVHRAIRTELDQRRNVPESPSLPA